MYTYVNIAPIQSILQFSLIHNPGLLSREYGLPLLDIENISDINDELSLELRWNQFLNVDHQAQNSSSPVDFVWVFLLNQFLKTGYENIR